MRNRGYRLFFWPAGIVLVLDQLSKLIVMGTLEHHASVPVINGFFSLVLVANRGMAFGIMNRQQNRLVFFLLILLAIAAIGVVIYWAGRQAKENPKILLGLGLVLGGAAGNLIDRLRLGYVVDFLDFFAGPYHWPAFNVADSAITIGTIWVALQLLRKGTRTL